MLASVTGKISKCEGACDCECERERIWRRRRVCVRKGRKEGGKEEENKKEAKKEGS